MPLDENAKSLIGMMEQAFPGGLHKVPLEQARAVNDEMAKSAPRPEVEHVEDRVVAGPAGDIAVRVYRPTDDQELPVIVWYHGGAFAIGSLDSADPVARELAVRSRAVVVSVDYRLAPENRFPSGIEDSYAVLTDVADNASSYGIDPSLIAVGGDSAGGTIAAVMAQMARDENGPDLVFQLLAYPTVLMRISSYEYADDPIVPAGMATHFWNLYVENDADYVSPRCAPMTASDLSGLAPALVLVPEVDSTRADQEEYARRLANAGVMASSKLYPGTPHGFFTLSTVLPQGEEALDDAANALRRAFKK